MKIVFFGDSITDMGRHRESEIGSVFSYGVGYTNFVVGELTNANPTGYECINRGISGNRVVDLYARVKSDVWNYSPDVLSILIGVNDVWHEINYQNGVEMDRWERVYRTMIEETLARFPNIKIMLLEPFIMEGSATDGEERWEKFLEVKEYAKVAKQIAEDYNLTFVPLQEKFDGAKEKFGADYYTYDGVHPSTAGARLIANEWLSAFKEKVEK